jgi:Domain of unknown function (DUF4422)
MRAFEATTDHARSGIHIECHGRDGDRLETTPGLDQTVVLPCHQPRREASHMRIYVAAHDNSPIAEAGYLARLQVGAALSGRRAGCLNDDEGDNISVKNPVYAELTGLYWLWKNIQDEVFGFCHYRRYFSPVLTPGNKVLVAPLEKIESVLSIDSGGRIFDHELSIADLVVPNEMVFDRSLEAQFLANHERRQDWFTMLAALSIVHPGEAKEAIRFFKEGQRFTRCNMFIGRREAIRAYCEWLFPILAEVELQAVRPDMPPPRGLCSFLSERLFTWWIGSRSLRLIRRPILMCE